MLPEARGPGGLRVTRTHQGFAAGGRGGGVLPHPLSGVPLAGSGDGAHCHGRGSVGQGQDALRHSVTHGTVSAPRTLQLRTAVMLKWGNSDLTVWKAEITAEGERGSPSLRKANPSAVCDAVNKTLND